MIAKERELLRFHAELLAKEHELKRWKEELDSENQLLQNKRKELDDREKRIRLLEKDQSEIPGILNFSWQAHILFRQKVPHSVHLS